METLGEQAEGFSKDEEVIVYPWIGEGLCPACRSGEENLCDKPRSLGIYTDGGYAEYVLVPSYKYLVNSHGYTYKASCSCCLGKPTAGKIHTHIFKPR